jgi:hypothetical protein
MALDILGSGRGLSDRRKTAAWNEDYLTRVVVGFVKSF